MTILILPQQQAEAITDKADKSPAYMYKKMLLLQKQKNERKQLRYAVTLHGPFYAFFSNYWNYALIRFIFDPCSSIIFSGSIQRSMLNIQSSVVYANYANNFRDTLRIETEQTVEELERKFELVRLREIKVKVCDLISQTFV